MNEADTIWEKAINHLAQRARLTVRCQQLAHKRSLAKEKRTNQARDPTKRREAGLCNWSNKPFFWGTFSAISKNTFCSETISLPKHYSVFSSSVFLKIRYSDRLAVTGSLYVFSTPSRRSSPPPRRVLFSQTSIFFDNVLHS